MKSYCGLVVGVMVCAGCSGGPKVEVPELQPVSGVVTLDGKPIPQAYVTFLPVKATGGLGGFASTDDDGEFSLLYPANNEVGCPEGQYKVLFQKLETPGGGPIPEGMTAADARAKNVIPPKYSQINDAINVVTIPSGGKSDFKFDLKRN